MGEDGLGDGQEPRSGYGVMGDWRIPGKSEPGGLPSMGLHRVGHN